MKLLKCAVCNTLSEIGADHICTKQKCKCYVGVFGKVSCKIHWEDDFWEEQNRYGSS